MAFKREVAARIFAQEFRSSDLFYRKDDSDKAPGFLVTPTGAEANRVLIVGTLTEKEDKSQDGDGSFIQIKIVDPTGQHYIYVSSEYQPGVAAVVAEIEPPQFVSVIAKTGIYDGGEEGGRFSKLRPEHISIVDAETRDFWIAETAKLTMDRITVTSEVARIMGLDGFTAANELDDLSKFADTEPAKKAIGYYGGMGTAAIERYREEELVKWRDMVKRALKSLHQEPTQGEEVGGQDDSDPLLGPGESMTKDGFLKRGPTIEEVEF